AGEHEVGSNRRGRGRVPARDPEDRRDRGLVVGAEDRLVPVREHPVALLDLDRARERHRVHVRADYDRARAHGAVDPRHNVAGVRARLGGARVLLRIESGGPQLVEQDVDDVALAARGALDLAEADEVAPQVVLLCARGAWRDGGRQAVKRRAAGSAGASSRSSTSRPSDRSSAAFTNSRKSGCGRSGRDLNSGWNCAATKNGWSGSSMSSTSRSSGDVPEQTRPAASIRLRRWLLTS